LYLRGSTLENDTHAFIIRIWHETDNGRHSVKSWRGSIDHVGSESRLYFYDFDGIASFIREQVGADTDNPISPFRSILKRLQDDFKKYLKKLDV